MALVALLLSAEISERNQAQAAVRRATAADLDGAAEGDDTRLATHGS